MTKSSLARRRLCWSASRLNKSNNFGLRDLEDRNYTWMFPKAISNLRHLINSSSEILVIVYTSKLSCVPVLLEYPRYGCVLALNCFHVWLFSRNDVPFHTAPQRNICALDTKTVISKTFLVPCLFVLRNSFEYHNWIVRTQRNTTAKPDDVCWPPKPNKTLMTFFYCMDITFLMKVFDGKPHQRG